MWATLQCNIALSPLLRSCICLRQMEHRPRNRTRSHLKYGCPITRFQGQHPRAIIPSQYRYPKADIPKPQSVSQGQYPATQSQYLNASFQGSHRAYLGSKIRPGRSFQGFQARTGVGAIGKAPLKFSTPPLPELTFGSLALLTHLLTHFRQYFTHNRPDQFPLQYSRFTHSETHLNITSSKPIRIPPSILNHGADGGR